MLLQIYHHHSLIFDSLERGTKNIKFNCYLTVEKRLQVTQTTARNKEIANKK